MRYTVRENNKSHKNNEERQCRNGENQDFRRNAKIVPYDKYKMTHT